MSECITNIKTFLFTTSQSCQLNLINYSNIYLPPTTPGEFLIKPPICFKLALSSVHLCKIPGIIKDLSIGKSVWVDSTVNWLGGMLWLHARLQQVPQPSWAGAMSAPADGVALDRKLLRRFLFTRQSVHSDFRSSTAEAVFIFCLSFFLRRERKMSKFTVKGAL